MNSHDTSPTQYRHFWPELKYRPSIVKIFRSIFSFHQTVHPQNWYYHTLFCILFNCTSPQFDVSIYFTVVLPIHQHHQLHQQLNPQNNILLRFTSHLKPNKHSHLTLTLGFEMIFQGFQPSDQQIEDLEQGNPINDGEHVRDAEQQQRQHLQQQQRQQDAVTRTLWYCTQHGSDEEHSGEDQEHFGEDNDEENKADHKEEHDEEHDEEHKEEHKEENNEEQKLSPDTQEQSHASNGTDSLSSTDANDPPQMPQKRKLIQRFMKRAHQIILIVPPLTSAL
jgi:hypothetical protein